ncbi:MAG TPA: hypothetical protein PL105_27655, partial [Caldilineaceae bacterium]|nr:hypothetical protein [Caldilineaceae bacterium]
MNTQRPTALITICLLIALALAACAPEIVNLPPTPTGVPLLEGGPLPTRAAGILQEVSTPIAVFTPGPPSPWIGLSSWSLASVARAAAVQEVPATPTDEPTATPTDEPTVTPTDELTATPTDEPTATPTETAAPIGLPSSPPESAGGTPAAEAPVGALKLDLANAIAQQRAISETQPVAESQPISDVAALSSPVAPSPVQKPT